MAIRRRPGSGQHFISTTKFGDRSDRERYSKTPLVREQGPIAAFFSALFGGGPGPFAASAIASRIARGLRFTKKAERLASQNATISSDSLLVESVSQQLREHVIDSYDHADLERDKLEAYLKQERGWLDECRPKEIIDKLTMGLNSVISGVHAKLGPFAGDLVTYKIKLEHFRHKNHLSDSVHWGKRADLAIFGQIGVLLMIEFIANSVFQADTQSTGLIGGVFVALLTSLATIILGVMFGFGYQRLHKSSQGAGWVGIGLLVLATILSFIFVSSLSLVRIAGESGDLHPLERARAALMANPFAGAEAMLDLPAFAYTLCIIALIVSVARKYLEYAGAFPGYRKRMLEFLDAERAFDEEYAAEVGAANNVIEDQEDLLDRAPEFITSCKVPIEGLVMDYDNVIDQYLHNIADIRGAGRLFEAYIAETFRSSEGGRVSVLSGEVSTLIDDKTTKLSEGHAAFKKDARELCSREDVSQETVDSARTEFHQIAESKLAALAEKKQELLDAALIEFRKEEAWRDEVLTPRAVELADTLA